MKVVITNAKAPWPQGAKVGDVVEVAPIGETAKGDPILPGCLVGKCKPAEEKAKAAHTYEQQLPKPVIAETALATLEVTTSDSDKLAEDLKVAEKLLAEARTEAGDLRGMVERANAERDAALAKVAELEAELAKKKK
jgi:hypothetical protein